MKEISFEVEIAAGQGQTLRIRMTVVVEDADAARAAGEWFGRIALPLTEGYEAGRTEA